MKRTLLMMIIALVETIMGRICLSRRFDDGCGIARHDGCAGPEAAEEVIYFLPRPIRIRKYFIPLRAFCYQGPYSGRIRTRRPPRQGTAETDSDVEQNARTCPICKYSPFLFRRPPRMAAICPYVQRILTIDAFSTLHDFPCVRTIVR